MLERCRILLIVLALTALAPEARPAAHHFVNGHIVTDRDAQPAEVLVVDGRIHAIGPALTAPEDAVVIDLEGGYLMPGLTEMHAHVPGPRQGEAYRDEVLFLFLANGVTTIRGMLGDPTHLQLRDDLIAGRVLGPRLITSGPSFRGDTVSSPEQAVRMVEAQAAAGYDFLKIHPGLTRPEYDAIAAAAKRLGIPFAGHVPAEVGLMHALTSGQATIDHLDGYIQALVPGLAGDDSGLFAIGLTDRADPEGIDDLVGATLAAGAAVVPTETLLENFAEADPATVIDRPQNAYLPRELLDGYRRALEGRSAGLTRASAIRFMELRKRLIRELHQGGVAVLLGSDAPQIFNVPGFSVHRELQAMTAAGLTPADAIILGTRNPALFFGMPKEFGSIRTEASADLVWLTANPLEDIANTTKIRGVMVRGRWLDRAFLDAGLEQIAGRHAP
jgi:imidazolonepropionase-like amidohydrolase